MASTISAGTTSGTSLAMAGDTSGSLQLQTNGTTTAVTISTAQNATFAGKVTSAGALTLASNGTTTAVTIDTSQNVGIGTASPTSKLDVNGNIVIGSLTCRAVGGEGGQISLNNTTDTATAYNFDVDGSNHGRLFTTQNNTNLSLGQLVGTGGIIALYTAGAERMRIDSSGDVIIGGTTSTAAARLNVYQADSSQRVVHFENTRNISSDENLRLVLGTNCNNTSSYQFIVTTAGADKLYIYGNGNIVNTNNSYGALSDTKLKENIVDATPKLADLMQVRVRNYNLIGDSTKQIGVVAQELETIFPAMVDESPDCEQQPKTREVEVPAVKEVKDENGNITTEAVPATTRTEEYTEQVAIGTVTKSVKYSVFVPMLIKAMQEQQALIIQLQADVAALKGVK